MNSARRALENLKLELQARGRAKVLESFAAAAVGRLVGVPLATANSGFQNGGDAGPAGRQGRSFRVECKKYSDRSKLSDRELLGEIDQALRRDESLEAWILVATRSVPEQLAQDLDDKAKSTGVPVIVVDWRDDEPGPLAALCAFAPDLVGTHISPQAKEQASLLAADLTDQIASLRRSLEGWMIGFDHLRSASHARLLSIWNSPRASTAELGQDAAGGARSRRIVRSKARAALDSWWNGSAAKDAPAALLGFEGVGKTWAVIDWLVERLADLPILLLVPASAAPGASVGTVIDVERFLAERLLETTGVRDAAHWFRRLRRLLKRPADEGPVLTLLFDGLNQEPSVQWLALLKILQHEVFAGRVRVVVTTRQHHFDERLSGLRSLVVPAAAIPIDVYDDDELDQMLAGEGLSRRDLHPDMIELARTPRLFELVVRLRDRFSSTANITLHGLLWEYGRDTFGTRAGRSFSEHEWVEWLGVIASRHRAGIESYSIRDLAATTARGDLTENEVFARLSDIIDGRHFQQSPAGAMRPSPTMVAHALGAALLSHLEQTNLTDTARVEPETIGWLDPIEGFDQRAEILRAAVSILRARGMNDIEPAASLITAWLQTQNATERHRREIKGLAPFMPRALLSAIERSDVRGQSAARLTAVNALRSVSRSDVGTREAVVARACAWLSVVSRDVDHWNDADGGIEERRSQRFVGRIGKDEDGIATVLGRTIELVENDRSGLRSLVPVLLEGYPVSATLRCFELAALSLAVSERSEWWKGFKWFCLFNEVDPSAGADALRNLSLEVSTRQPEDGVHPALPARVASLLLWLSGLEDDEEAAAASDPGIGRWLVYEQDYLASPGRSLFPLERRHAIGVLLDVSMPIVLRVRRTADFWIDPSFEPPAAFVDELRHCAKSIDVDALDAEDGPSGDRRFFEDLQPAFARCAPDILARLVSRKLTGYSARPATARYWTALGAIKHWLLVGVDEAAAVAALRAKVGNQRRSDESYASSQLLLLEIRHLDAVSQFDAVIAADLESIGTDFREVLKPVTASQADFLLAKYEKAADKAQRDFVVLLSVHPGNFSGKLKSWLFERLRTCQKRDRGLLFRLLAINAPAEFGRTLLQEGWKWDANEDPWVNHYGSGALIDEGSAVPFDQLVPRIAPWRILEGVRKRGGDPAETELAAQVFGHVLSASKLVEVDSGSDLSVDCDSHHGLPFVFFADPRPDENEKNDPQWRVKSARDADAVVDAHRRASETAASRIESARKSGASLYLADIAPEDFIPVFRYAPRAVADWLSGFEEVSLEFRRRVRLAEQAYMSLCEALLSHDPERGVRLWRAIRSSLTTRYIGRAGIEIIVHMAFRAPASPALDGLLSELLDPRHSNTDRDLYDLAVAASINGRRDWLRSVIDEDAASPLAWRRKRGLVMSGWTAGNSMPVEGAWAEGKTSSDHGQLRTSAAFKRLTEACARHWWRRYLDATNLDDAYSAWTLFCRAADHRVLSWMMGDISSEQQLMESFADKLAHLRLNHANLEKEMKSRLDKYDRKFFGQDIVRGLSPWGGSDRY